MACKRLTKSFSLIPRLYSANCYRTLCTHASRLTNEQVRKKRLAVYEEEKAHQLSLITRMEKIQVEYKGILDECTLVMNKGLSTPFNCAMHIAELLMTRSVVALVNGKLWDMHKPLTEDCTIDFLHFKEDNQRLMHLVNKTFWRSCSFILGHVLETAFTEDYYVELCSFPGLADAKMGSIVYDVDLKIKDWKPNQQELDSMSRIAFKLQNKDIRLERLEVDASVAEKMFEDNRFKTHQIPMIASRSNDGNTVVVYRMGDHVDISNGPLMSSTNLLQRFNVSAIHEIESKEYGTLQRVQGLAMPKQLPIHYWTYEFLVDCSRKLSKEPIPPYSFTPKPDVTSHNDRDCAPTS